MGGGYENASYYNNIAIVCYVMIVKDKEGEEEDEAKENR
jgi:hypothetical protein